MRLGVRMGIGVLVLGLGACAQILGLDEFKDAPASGHGGGGAASSTGGMGGGGSGSGGMGGGGSGSGGMGGDVADCVGVICDEYCYMNTCFSCFDGIRNGNEVGTDCGGFCKKCIADPCGAHGECASTFCFDGVCCREDCNATCRACNVPGYVGSNCVNLPAGAKDLDGAEKCLDTQACNAGGQCVDKVANGEGCTSNFDCASNNCVNGVCSAP